MVWTLRARWRSGASSTLAGLGTAGLCLAVAWRSHTWGDLALFLMVSLLGAVRVAWRWGRLAAAVTALVMRLREQQREAEVERPRHLRTEPDVGYRLVMEA